MCCVCVYECGEWIWLEPKNTTRTQAQAQAQAHICDEFRMDVRGAVDDENVVLQHDVLVFGVRLPRTCHTVGDGRLGPNLHPLCGSVHIVRVCVCTVAWPEAQGVRSGAV